MADPAPPPSPGDAPTFAAFARSVIENVLTDQLM